MIDADGDTDTYETPDKPRHRNWAAVRSIIVALCPNHVSLTISYLKCYFIHIDFTSFCGQTNRILNVRHFRISKAQEGLSRFDKI